jgi:hypothetical protein
MNICILIESIMALRIPEHLLAEPDRKAAFRGIKAWMEQAMQPQRLAIEGAIGTGAPSLDEALGGGYAPGKVTELVESRCSQGASSLIRGALRTLRSRGRLLALVDACNQFDPQSSPPTALESLLWVRCKDQAEALKACDILLRDSGFPLVMLDLRKPGSTGGRSARATDWYRLQRASTQSHIALVVLTCSSMVPSAHHRLALTGSLSLDLLDENMDASLHQVCCEALKRTWFEPSKEQEEPMQAMGGGR